MQILSLAGRTIALLPLLLGIVALSTVACSSFVESRTSASGAETRFGTAVGGSQLSASDVEEIALRLQALPPFAEQRPEGLPSLAGEGAGSFGLIARGDLAGD